MHIFNIQLFGAVEVSQNGRPLTSFRSQKTLALLAYLISGQRPFTRDHLAGLFWPDVAQGQALGHLRRALHNLSKNLPGCLEITRRTAAFRPDAPVEIDTHRFAQLCQQEDPAQLAQAAALIRAPFLEGVYFDDCLELESWIAGEQNRWRQQAVTLLNKLVETAVRRGDYDYALTYAQQLAGLDPLQETHHRQLMQLYVKTGKREAALAQFAACRDLFAAELDLAPSASLTALHQRIREMTAVRHNLPPSPTPFIGRETELAELAVMLANPDCRLITIAGPGGIGKTRLALALAGQSANHFLEGVWLAELADITAPAGLLTALGIALNLALLPSRDPARQLLDYLRNKELLLLLDNFEQLADTPELVAAILSEAPDVKLLVTSRRPLNLHEEWMYDLDGLPAAAAAQLFVQTARRRTPAFDPAAEAAAVNQICQLTQGVPLALEMAAAACRDMPCAAVAEGIAANLDILQTPLRNLPERHRSVQAVFNQSWALLDETAQAAYACLSLFQGSFLTAAAADVTGVTRSQIAYLLANSLVRQKGDSRFELHELLRRYAREKLEQNPAVANEIAFRHAAYFTGLLAKIGGNKKGATHTAVTPDLGNIIAAWQWAAGQGQWHLLAQAAAPLRDYFLDMGSPQAGIAHLDAAIDQLAAAQAVPERQPQPPAWLHGRLLAHKAHLLVRSGQSDDCRHPAQQALALVIAIPDPAAEVEATYALAFADFNQGDFERSRRLAEAGLALAQAHDLGRLAVLCLNHAGRCCLETNDMEMAQAYFERAAAQARSLAFFQYEISANINLGLVQNSRGHYQEAEALLLQALAQAEQRDYHAMSGSIYLNLGTVCFHLGRYADGQAHYRAAQRVYRQSGSRENLGLSHHAQAIVALEMGDFLAARGGFEQALYLYEEMGSRYRQLIMQGEMSHVLGILGQFSAAGQYKQKAFALLAEIGEVNDRLNLHVQAVWLALEMGDLDAAEQELAQVAALLPTCQIAEQQCLAHLVWSRYWQYRGQLAAARASGEEALSLAREKEKRKLPDCAVRLGMALVEEGEAAAARPLFAESLQIRETRNQPHLAAEARAGLAQAALALGEVDTAVAHAEAILQFLDRPDLPNTFLGTQEPALIYLICYEVLQAAGDVRGTAVLEEGIAFLEQRAAGLDDTRRHAFWKAVPAHRRLAAAKREREGLSER